MKTIKGISLFIMAALTLAACGGKETKTTEETTERIEQVKVMKIDAQEIEREINVSSTLQGYETVKVSPSIQGIIEKIYVEIGDKVRADEMLVRMDQNQLNTSEIVFANLQVELDRMKKLRETGSVAQQALDQMQLSYDQTKQNIDFLQKNTFVKAPFSGVISAKNYEDGELYAGQPIVTLTQINRLKSVISVPERHFPIIKEGMAFNIFSDIYPNDTFPSKVEIIYPTIDPASHTFQVKLNVPNGKELLRPGMYIRTVVGLGKENAVVVPYQAVLKLQGSNERYIFLNNNGVAQRVTVELGQRFDDKTEIIANIPLNGKELIIAGQARLVDGIKLNVVK